MKQILQKKEEVEELLIWKRRINKKEREIWHWSQKGITTQSTMTSKIKEKARKQWKYWKTRVILGRCDVSERGVEKKLRYLNR